MKVTSFRNKYLKEFIASQRRKRLEKKFIFLIFVLGMIKYYQMIINKEVNITEVLPLISSYNNRFNVD